MGTEKSYNILIIAIDFKPMSGGVSEYTHQIAKHLYLLGNNITVLSPHMEGDKKFDESVEYEIIRFTPPVYSGKGGLINKFRRVIFYFNLIREIAVRTKADILLPNGIFSLIFYCFMVSKFLNIPYVTIAYGLEINQWRDPSNVSFKYKVSLKNAVKIFCISNFTFQKLVNIRINPDKLSIIHPAVNPDKFFPNQEASKKIREKFNLTNKKIILTLSRLVERKGIDKVIESILRVLKEVPEAVYLVGGNGSFKGKLRDIVKSYNLQDKVIFMGYIPEREKADYYNACDVFVMPSRELKNGSVEGFGIVFLEANACGKPVIGSYSGGIPDAIVHGATGLLVDPLDVNEIALSLILLLKKSDYAKKLGLKGRDRILKELNWKIISNKLLNEINKLG